MAFPHGRILKKFFPLFTVFFFLSSWSGKWKVEMKSNLFPSCSKPSFNLCSIIYDILLFYKDTIIILIFSDEATEALRNLRLWAKKHLGWVILTHTLIVFSTGGLRTQVTGLNLLFTSHDSARRVFLTLIKSMPLESQNHPHPMSLHSEIFIFLYKVPLFENHNVVLYFFYLSPFPFIDFCQVSCSEFWLY